MWKRLVIASAALMIVGACGIGSLSVLAQQAPEQSNRPLFSREDAAAFLEARIAALHAGLQLTPEQERLWPPFEQAYRERGKLRIARISAAVPPNEDPIARLQRRADALLQQGGVLKRLADAAAPLWQSLDEGQKRRFAALARPFNRQIGIGFGRGFGSRGDVPGRDGGRFGLEGGRSGRGFDFGPRMGFGGTGRDGDERAERRTGPPGFGPGGGQGAGSGLTGRGPGPRMRFGGRDGDDFGPGRGSRDDYGQRDGGDFGRDRGQYR